ncbi:MAG: heme oxygenase [Hydrogenophilales bacterium 28-61-23]|nr:MAG: heme oxygenase [Hydrogenophilales bacterium 28-61-23]
MSLFEPEFIASLQDRLDRHPIYAAVESVEDLRVFMQHHVHSVWDFMSLIKYLQYSVAPARWPWTPGADPTVQRFINELVLEEETDAAGPDAPGEFSSHFALYLGAMREIGADADKPARFVEIAGRDGIETALAAGLAPDPSARFNRASFAYIDGGKPHEVAAALALGREHIIPTMFRAMLKRMAVTEEQAPIFHYYLKRHIHLDEDFHAPLSLRLLYGLCGDDPVKLAEARAAAIRAVEARVEFWDGVLAALPSQKKDTGFASTEVPTNPSPNSTNKTTKQEAACPN